MDIKKEIEKTIKENNFKKEQIKEKKDKEYLISTNLPNLDLMSFLGNFEDLYDISEVIKNKYVSFKIKDDENEEKYKILKKVYETYFLDIEKKLVKSLTIKDIFTKHDLFNSYIEERYPHQTNDYLEEINEKDLKWTKKKHDSHEKYINANIEEIEKNFIKFMQKFYKLTEEDAKKIIKIVKEEFLSIKKELGILIKNEIHIFRFESKIESSREDIRFASEKIREFSNENEKKIREYYEKESKIKNKVLSELNMTELEMKDLNLWEKAYSANNQDFVKRIDEKMRNGIKEMQLIDAETITGFPTFSFFNYYNISEREYSTIKPLIREISNIYLAKEMVLDKELIYSNIEKLIDKINKKEDVSDFKLTNNKSENSKYEINRLKR